MLKNSLEQKIKLTSLPDSMDNTKPIHTHKSIHLSNNIMNTSTTSNTTIESNINSVLNTESCKQENNKKIYVYKRNIIKKKNQSPSTKKNKETYNISNNPKSQRVIIHSSSSGNLISKFTQNYNNNDQNIKQEDTFINIEDLLLLEDKFCDVIYALNIKSSNLSNECFELLNFYNNSSLYNKFENYYKKQDYKKEIHKLISLLMYDIILCYNISFDKNFLITSNDVLSTILNLNHKSYLILCEYINSKISSSSLGNTWVKKLKDLLLLKLERINMNNRDYIQFLINQNSKNNFIDYSNSIYEIKFYSYLIEKYLRVLLKNFSYDQLNEDFVKIFKSLDLISNDEINNFFRKKVVRVINKNASILGSDLTQNEINNSPIKIPYLNQELIKEFSLVLDLVSKYYELIIFTAATKEYADPILDAIESNKLYFDYRLYRQHTIVYNNDFIKDLSKLGRDLSKVIIVDNMSQNFKLQKDNGITIRSFWGKDVDDLALIDLLPILLNIAKNNLDVRDGISLYKNDILDKVTSNIFRAGQKNNV